MLRPFALLRPATVGEAAELLAGHGADVALYAGGTELLLMMKEGLVRVRGLVDVKRIPALRGVAATDGQLRLGAAVTHAEVERSAEVRAHCPLVAKVARHVANIRVRSVGTVGGNLAFADPHSDLTTLFLVFDAAVDLATGQSARALPLGEFVTGAYETARAPEELLTGVRLRPWPARTAGAYLKFGVHERPTLGVAVALTLDAAGAGVTAARLAVGCVGPRPLPLPEVEETAAGRSLAEVEAGADAFAARAAAVVDPVTDAHGSAEYKRAMVRVFVRRALRLAAARAAGRESHARYPHTVVV